jgi:hypothetical protein
VGSLAPDQQHWLIEPLLAAGMDLDEIRSLVTHLAAEAGTGPGGAAGMTSLVEDRPPEVRAAWTEMIGRMLQLGEPAQTD